MVIWGLHIPVLAVMLYHSHVHLGLPILKIALVFAGGIFFWTLFEYLIHRFVFNFIAKSERALRFVYVVHGNHHEYPRDKERLFMPPVPSLIIASLVFSLMFFTGWALGISSYTFVFFRGFILGYLIYGSMHYAIHAWNPPFKWMKPL